MGAELQKLNVDLAAQLKRQLEQNESPKQSSLVTQPQSPPNQPTPPFRMNRWQESSSSREQLQAPPTPAFGTRPVSIDSGLRRSRSVGDGTPASFDDEDFRALHDQV